MKIADFASAFVECLDFDTLIVWADILNVPHDENYWTDDDMPDKEDDLRVAVAEAMSKVEKEWAK